jgi:hypothetical protein
MKGDREMPVFGQQIKDSGNRLNAAMLELKEAQGGTWLDAAEVAIGAITRATYQVYDRRADKLRDRLCWLPWRWQYWVSEHWPRKWLPRL